MKIILEKLSGSKDSVLVCDEKGDPWCMTHVDLFWGGEQTPLYRTICESPRVVLEVNLLEAEVIL